MVPANGRVVEMPRANPIFLRTHLSTRAHMILTSGARRYYSLMFSSFFLMSFNFSSPIFDATIAPSFSHS